jgi:hypothetical protein
VRLKPSARLFRTTIDACRVAPVGRMLVEGITQS